jgi:hypothetical protein
LRLSPFSGDSDHKNPQLFLQKFGDPVARQPLPRSQKDGGGFGFRFSLVLGVPKPPPAEIFQKLNHRAERGDNEFGF